MTVGNSGKSVVATKTTDLTSITAVLVSPKCKPSLTISSVKEATTKVSTSSFTNAELTSLLMSGETGIVFAFSEGMYHSVQSLETIKKVAQKQNLKLTILRDPEFRTKNYGTVSKLASTELILRGMTIHYPSVMVYSKGELKGQALVGRKTEDQYVQWVKKVIQ